MDEFGDFHPAQIVEFSTKIAFGVGKWVQFGVDFLQGVAPSGVSNRRLRRFTFKVPEDRYDLRYEPRVPVFTGLGFDQSMPDHSTFSKNRHGRFRDSSVFHDLFETIVQQCVNVGLVQGERLSVDGTIIAADMRRAISASRDDASRAARLKTAYRRSPKRSRFRN